MGKPWQRGLVIAAITSLLMILTINFWSVKEIKVQFNSEAAKDIEYQIFYASLPDKGFSEAESVKKTVEAGKQDVKIILPVKKIFKFRIDPGQNPGKVVLSDIRLKGQHTINIDDGNKFIYQNHIDDKKIEGRKISIVSNQSDPYIVYKEKFELEESRDVEFCVLVICLFFSFFVACKSVNYLAKFKITELCSRIDIVFLACFFVMLFIPMSRISDAEKSEQENRMLAKFPTAQRVKTASDFSKQFEAWFNDRFLGRKFLVDIHDKVLFYLNKYYATHKAFMGKDGWMFNNYSQIQKRKISQKELKQYQASIKSFLQFCGAHDIKCYIEIVPRKVEFAKDKVHLIYRSDEQDIDRTIKQYISDTLNFEIVFPYDELQKANQESAVFYKTDHHWTEWGAYNAYLALIEKIKKDFSFVSAVSEDSYEIRYSDKVRAEYHRDFWMGSVCKDLNLSNNSCPLYDKYKYYTPKNEKDLEIKWIKGELSKDFYYKKSENDYKAMIISDSFSENFVSFLPYSFSELRKRRFNNLKEGQKLSLSRWKKEIKDFKPDILIILIESEAIHKLKELKD